MASTMLSYREAFVLADKNTLRRCESLLMRLPREVTSSRPAVRKPIWVFLKGIQGFDDARAAECLSLLLDAQFDSLSILKLATTQDLIEDAGLRPEDALDIVSNVAREHVDTVVEPTPIAVTGFALPWACT